MNVGKDIPQVLALLNLVFSASLGGQERRRLRRMSLSQQPWIVLRLRQLVQGIVPGYVWEESGVIVGNASLLTTTIEGRFLVANVAVHPDYRRQGIARTLMESLLDVVDEQGGREILLQVRQDNEAAIGLYESLGFATVGSMKSWYGSTSRPHRLPAPVSAGSPDRAGDYTLRPLHGDEWKAAWRLDCHSVHPDLNWPEPLEEDAYRQGLWRRLLNLFTGRRFETWVAEDGHGQMAALATILSQWGRAHTLSLRVHPRCRGQVERLLLAKVLRRLQRLPRRKIRIEHPDGDEDVETLLQQANFTPRRVLTTMRLTL